MSTYGVQNLGTLTLDNIEIDASNTALHNSGDITVVSKERHPAYFRPLISYYLEGKSKAENISCRGENFYNDNNCKVIYNTVTAIDKNNKPNNIFFIPFSLSNIL